MEERPNRPKQEFRALRELVGLTQQAFADALGVKVLSIKRWEMLTRPQVAPAAAWALLDALDQSQRLACSHALEQVARASGAESVTVLPYWNSAESFAESRPKADVTWTEANATSRRVGAVLMDHGVRVTWSSEDKATVEVL